MHLARRFPAFVSPTLAAAALSLSAPVTGSTVEVYPGPGADAYKSALYTVEVSDGSAWVPAYVYGFKRLSRCHWHYGDSPSVNFVTFGTSGAVDVRVTRVAGPINSVDISPHSRRVAARVESGRAIQTLAVGDKLWLTVNGDDANPLFLFADGPRPGVPAGATYFGPGVRDIAPAAGNHYKASTGEAIYLDGGAWVRGTIDIRGTRNVRIMGPGILSGDLWKGENVGSGALPFDDFLDYAMVRGDYFGGNGATVRGVTILDSPGYNFFGGAEIVEGIKVISPWWFSTDGFPGVSHVDHCFIFNGDNSFAPSSAGIQNDDATITASFGGTTNNSVFTGGYWGYESHRGYTALVDDVDIKTYENGEWVTKPEGMLAAAFQVFVDNADPTQGYSNQTYQNVRIEGNVSVPVAVLKNVVYIFDPDHSPNPPLGNSYNFTFRNITLEGTQKYHSQVQGWDENNGFHNVVLDNARFGGQLITTANLDQFFDVQFVTGSVTANPDYLAGVLPVVGSAPGSHGSYFKTAMQAYNPGSSPFTLRVVFHPSGKSASAGDPSKTVTIGAGAVLYYADLLPAMGVASGLGSLDVFLPTGETRRLTTTFRVYNDGGSAGTSGFNEELVPFNKFFVSGATVVLTCPPDPSKARLNVGVRTLADGASLTATLRNAAGGVVKTAAKNYAPNYFEQVTLDTFLGGAAVTGNETLTIQIGAGEAVIYGATVDNTTNDSSASLAQRQ